MSISVNSSQRSTEAFRLSRSSNYANSQELEDRYFKNIKKEYATLNLKKNTSNIFQKDKVTITLSPELIKKACKDEDVDKALKKSLDDAVKNKKAFKAYSCTKDGKKVNSISFFIDGRQRTSCSIRLENKDYLETEEEKRSVSRIISNEISRISKKSDINTSLYYKYISLLYNNKFTLLDMTV